MTHKALYDSNAAMYVLGTLLRDPTILAENNYALTETDFLGLHKIIFGGIYNIAGDSDRDEILPQDVDLHLKQFERSYASYQKENGYEVLQAIYELVDMVNRRQFTRYYERLKKFTILRDLYSNGVDIKEFYDPEVDFTKIDEENKKLNDTPIEEIFNKIRAKLSVVEDRNINKDNHKAKNAAVGLRSLLQELKESPEVGPPLDGEMLNYVSRGARQGKLYLYSAPSGHGKTRFLVGNACSLSMPYIKNGKIIKKQDLSPILFIATEMDPDEIQTLIIAYVTGIDEEKIITGHLTDDEQKLLDIGVNIVEEYSDNFRIEKISDPNISTLRAKATKYILNDRYKHIFYDYIFTSPGLNFEFGTTGLREDVVLMMLSNTLKEIAADFGVFVYSGTQVNRGWEKAKFRTENNLAGSKAIADKIDFGVIGVQLTDEESDEIKDLIRADGIKDFPNIVLDVYKNRRGKYTKVKIYRKFDYGTCRSVDLIMTDTHYNKINVGKIEYKSEKQDLLDLEVDKNGGEN
ncbi:MAG: DnaB-like helicase C-terminal domain-containing protein [Bacillota bacterium]